MAEAMRLSRLPELVAALRRRQTVLCLGAAALGVVCAAVGVEEICLEAACAAAQTTAEGVERALAAAQAQSGRSALQACSGVVAVVLAPTTGTDSPVVVRAYASLGHIAAVVAASMRTEPPPPRPWRVFGIGRAKDAGLVDRWCSGRTAQHAAVARAVRGHTRIGSAPI